MKKHVFVPGKGRGQNKECAYKDANGLTCGYPLSVSKHVAASNANLSKLLTEPSTIEVAQELTAYEGGATRTAKSERRELIPKSAMDALARRLALGAAKHGVNNWRKGGEAFRQATINHLLDHIFEYLENGGSENTDAIICNAAFLCEYELRAGHPGVARTEVTE